MNKIEFMDRLSYLLHDLSEEEQEDALQYYKDYFDDAGVDNEANVINELGSPERVAAIIRANLQNVDGSDDLGEFTENGYENPLYRQNYYEVTTKSAVKDSGSANSQRYGDDKYEKEPYNDSNYRNGDYQKNRKSINWPPFLIIAVAIITSPFWLTIVCGGIGLLLGLLGLAIGVLVCLVFSFFISAISCTVIGVIELFTIPIVGIFLIGVSLILFALGLLFLVLNIWFFKFCLPKCIQWIGNICKIPFKSKKIV